MQVSGRVDLVERAVVLVTKERYFDKPTYASLASSVAAMAAHAVKQGVKRLCLPRIGGGLDRLAWPKVRHVLEDAFAGTGVAVVVYHL
jgi:hypothetical protein